MKELSIAARTIPLSPIREMFDLSLGMQDVISFTLGEPDFSTPSHIVEAAVTALRNGEHHYTPNAGILPLRKAISDFTQKSHGLFYDPEGEIIVTNGGTEALVLAMMTLLNPGDECLMTDPCWTNYATQLMLINAVPGFVPVDKTTSFQFTAEGLEKAITPKTKCIIINSPANPTGGIADRRQLEEIARIAIQHDLYVISDEVYAMLLYENNSAPSIACINGMRERTIIVNSFSKSYAMTGWRVGYAMGAREIIANMVKLQESLMACVNSASQFAAAEALNGTQEPLHEMQRTYARRRETVLRELSTVKGLECFAPQGAFYALIDIAKTKMKARDFAKDLLKKARVIIVPGEAFGKTSDHYLRLSFATKEENIIEGIRRIREYMDRFPFPEE